MAATAAAGGSTTLSADSVRRWSTADVAAWLQSVRLEAHASVFEANHINGQVILDVDKNALKQMGIATVGDRVRLDKAIRDLKRATNTGAGAGGSQPVSATNSVISSAGGASGFQRPIAVSHSADQLGIHRTASSSGMGPGSGPVRQASTGLLVNHHQQAQYQLYAYNQQQQQQQQQQSMMSAQHYHSSPYSSSSLTLPYSTASGAASSYSLSPSGGHPLPPLPADAHTTPSQSRPSTGASAGAPPPLADGTSSRPSTSGGSVSNMGVPASSATLGLGSSSSSSSSASTGPNAFSQRRSAHQRPPPLQLAHSANYALANPNLPPGGSSSTLAPSSIPGAASSPYRARSSSGTSASALGVPGSGNPLTHSLFVNGQPHPNQNAGSIHSHLTPGQQQAAAQATPTGPPPTTIIGTGWTAHPAQGPSVSGQASSSSAASSSARLPSPTYPNNPNPNIQYTMHRKQLSSSQLTAASSGSRTRTAAAEYTSSMQTVGPGVRNHNASSYVKKGYAPPGSSGGRPDKSAGLYAHQAGGHPAYGGYYGAVGGGSGHAHHLSTSSNSSTSAGSAQPGVASTATSPIAAVFTPSTARPGGVYGGSDESGLEGGNSPYSRTPTTPSYPGSVSQAMEHGGPSHAIPIQSNAMDPRLRSVYQPVGIGGSSLSNANMYTPEDVTRRKLKFHCEDLGSTHKVLVSDCQDAYDVLARVLRTFGIRGGTGINAYPPYHGQSMNDPESDEDDDGNQYGIAIESDDTWAIFASSPDGKTKMLSDNELIAVCHAPQPHDPLRERGLHLRRIGANNSKFQQTRRNNKLNKFFGESEIPEAGSAAAGAGNGQGQVSPGPGRGAGRDYESESYENIAPLSSNANRKPKMNRASTISFMSGLGLGAGRNSASAEREQMMLQHQQNMALQQFREQHSAQIVQVPAHAHAPAAMYAMPGAPAQAAFSNEISAPLQPPPMPSSAAAAATAAAAAATATASTAQINPSTSGSSMLGLLPRRARHLFGHRPPSELISSNLQDYFPATEKKVLERTARRSVYGKASVRSKRDSTWSFKPPDWIADIGDEEGEPVPIRRSGESYEFRKGYDGADADSMQEHIKLEVGSNGEEVERIQVQRAHSNASSRSGTSSNPERNPRARSGKSGPPTLPPVVGRNSLDDWAASLQTAASPVEEYPRGSKVGPSSFDSMPETPTAIPRGISNARDDGSLLAPNAASRKDNASTSPSIGSSPLPSSSSQTLSSSMHLHRPRSVRRNSGESSRSRRSFARFQQYGHTGDRDRSDAASLLTVDEITQDIESRNENAHFLATSGADWLGATIAVGGVIDADGNPVPTRMSMTGRWTGGGDADSISIRSKKPTILLTDDDRSSINARSMRSLKRNKSSASRRKAIPSVSATGSGRSSATEDQKDVGGSTTLHTAEEGASASPSVGNAPQEEEDEEDDTFDEEDEDFDEGDELDEEEEPDEAEEITHPAHRAGKARRKWIKGALIGAGSFGSVFLGMDQRTGLYMAVKQVELPTGKSDNEQRKMSMLEALEREIALLKTFEHPNIVQYLDSYADDSHLNIFLEYVPGGSVVAILRDWGTFQEPLVQAFITQTLLGLQFLHGREIIHSDIKGANILVDTKGQIKISDFGISKKDAEVIASSSKAPKKTALQGSVFWMAPEAVKQTSSSRKADIWSVGCLVVEMLTGMHPWPSLNQMQALFRIGSMKATPPMPEDISENCRHFLNWTFELDHTKRPTADDLLAHKFLMEVAQLEPDVPMGGTEDDNDGDDTVVTGASSSRVLTVNSTNTVGSVASGRKGKGKRKGGGGGGGGGVNAGAAGTSAAGLAALAAD
ncbi:hypothetical protein CF326_g2178 [Tilletia indica]|nr:hypothetical protein CF326_g2178 [Tilletia indica]